MNKLKLNLEDLEVNSFEAGTSADVRGTVRGASEPAYSAMCPSWQYLQYLTSTWMQKQPNQV